ncbi:hypothetical protein TNCV_3665241 [Trichonephila clavipes]|nr:hypothetical protein TNCV_3665241 [Trichonephila clavipes]
MKFIDLNCSYPVERGLGLTSKIDIWVPDVLMERSLGRHFDVCDLFLKRQENDSFLKCIPTGEEKWLSLQYQTQ